MAQAVEVLACHNTNDNKPVAWPAAAELRVLGTGDYLYKEGELRAYLYRVEKGVIAVFERRIGRPANIVEMASQGDYVGLGCLEQYRDNARAAVECTLSIVQRSEFALLVERDPKLKQKQDDAIKRDFEFGKVLATDRGRSAPVERVAAFLVAVSRQNANEGRDPTIVSDSLKCGIVASLLDLDITSLGRALLKLQGMDLVEQKPAAGLYLKNIEALERIADGYVQDMEAAVDDITAQAAIAPRPSSARSASSSQRLAAREMNPSSWRGELLEASWLVSLIGGLSVIGVGLAVMFAIALG